MLEQRLQKLQAEIISNLLLLMFDLAIYLEKVAKDVAFNSFPCLFNVKHFLSILTTPISETTPCIGIKE